MESDSAQRVDDVPIFPLGTVLFPGALLPLHIFEDRYKKMMRYAIESGGKFGLSYSEHAAVDKETAPEVGSVGCMAKISAVMPLDAGRMNIVSTGTVRYRVVALTQITPYVIGRVELFRDDPEPDVDLVRRLGEMLEVAREFIEVAQSLDESSVAAISELPEEPEDASLLIASVLPLDNKMKQSLLEMTSARLRLRRLKALMEQMLPDYRERLLTRTRAARNGHGKLTNIDPSTDPQIG